MTFSFNKRDETFMKAALVQAELGAKEDEIPVGCVFVKNNEIIGRGHNLTNITRNGTKHAEMNAIETILAEHKDSNCTSKKRDFNGSNIPSTSSSELEPFDWSDVELYVTLEPCIMCASALSIIGIKSVVFGATNDRFGGNGSVLSLHIQSDQTYSTPWSSYTVKYGLFAEEAVDLLRKCYEQSNPRAPNPHRKPTTTTTTTATTTSSTTSSTTS